MKTRGVPGNQSVSSFYPEGGALTHHPRSGRWYPSFVGLVRSSRSIHRMLLQRGRSCRGSYSSVVMPCAAGSLPDAAGNDTHICLSFPSGIPKHGYRLPAACAAQRSESPLRSLPVTMDFIQGTRLLSINVPCHADAGRT